MADSLADAMNELKTGGVRTEPVAEVKAETPVVATIEAPVVVAPVVEKTPEQLKSETDAAQASEVAYTERFGKELGIDPTTAKQRLADYEKINNEYGKLKAEPPKAPYKTDFGAKADELYARGVKPATIAKFVGLDVAKLSDEDKIKLSMQVKNPSWKESHINAKYNQLYGTKEVDENSTDDERQDVELKDADRIQAATEAAKELEQYTAQIFTPADNNKPDPIKVQAETNRVAFYDNQGIKNVSDQFKEIKIPVKYQVHGSKGPEDVSDTFSYPIPDTDKQVLLTELSEMVRNPAMANAFPPGEEGTKAALGYLMNRNAAINSQKMAEAYGNFVASKIHESYKKLLNNPIGVNGGVSISNGAAETAEEARYRRLMAS